MEYEVEREHNQYHVREKGQVSRGTTLTDGWLRQMGFWPLSRLNIDAAIEAATASVMGYVLDPHAARRLPKEIVSKDMFTSYPARGRQGRPHIPDRIMFKGG